MIELMIVKLL